MSRDKGVGDVAAPAADWAIVAAAIPWAAALMAAVTIAIRSTGGWWWQRMSNSPLCVVRVRYCFEILLTSASLPMPEFFFPTVMSTISPTFQ